MKKLDVEEIEYDLYEENGNTTGCLTIIENKKSFEKTSICNPNASDNYPPEDFIEKLKESKFENCKFIFTSSFYCYANQEILQEAIRFAQENNKQFCYTIDGESMIEDDKE